MELCSNELWVLNDTLWLVVSRSQPLFSCGRSAGKKGAGYARLYGWFFRVGDLMQSRDLTNYKTYNSYRAVEKHT